MEWISVKDQSPEHGEDVLFVNGFNEVSVGERFAYEKETNKRCFDDADDADDAIYFHDCLNTKTAICRFWMPLPKPPTQPKE